MEKSNALKVLSIELSLMSKVITNDKGITSRYDGRTKTKVVMAWHGIVENVA